MITRKTKLTKLQINELNTYKDSNQCSVFELRRIQAILLLDRKNDFEFIKDMTGFNKRYVFALRKKYLLLGIKALADKPSKKPRALLTKGQREQISKVLKMLTPRAFGYEIDYWTVPILAALIKEQYNVQYKSKTSISLLFKEANFTYHKPDMQYKNRNQAAIDKWKEDYTPLIEATINDDNMVVLFEDEMMLTTQTTTQKIWLPQGEFPKIDVASNRQLRCIYGFLNVQNGVEHAFKALGANSEETCKVLEKIGRIYKNKKIVLIWDNASWHKSAQIKEFLSKTKHRFHLIQLPPYAPELNPQEHVWKTGRSNVTHNNFIENIDKATNEFIEHLNNSIFDYKSF